MHGILKDNYSDAQKVDETCQNIPRTYGKLTEDTTDVRKADGLYEKLMEDPATTRKVE